MSKRATPKQLPLPPTKRQYPDAGLGEPVRPFQSTLAETVRKLFKR